MTLRFTMPKDLPYDESVQIRFLGLMDMLDPLEKAWPDIVIEAQMAIRKDPNPRVVGEILARGFRELIENIHEEPFFKDVEARGKHLGAALGPNATENDVLSVKVAKCRREIKNLRAYIVGQDEVIADLLGNLEILTEGYKAGS